MINALDQRNNFLLELIHRALVGGGGGAASNVDITGNSIGLSLEATQQLVLAELQRLANIEIDVDTINLNTDQLETLLAQISAKLPATLGKKTSAQSLAVTLDTNFTQTVKGYYTTVVPINISGVQFNLNDIVVEYSTDLSSGGLPLSYLVNVTTGLNTPNVSLTNSQLNSFRPFTGNFTVPSDLVRESVPFQIETLLGIVGSNTFNINQAQLDNAVYLNNLEKASQCIVRTIADSPAVGDTTYYIGHNNTDFKNNGILPPLNTAVFSIKRVQILANEDVNISWADNARQNYNLVFDDGSQNYLTYSY
jgi:hypothetical protein